MPCYIAYLRVSTQKQGNSGLGLEAQKEAVQRYLKDGDTIVSTYTEVESGKYNSRPQLQAALKECRLRKATLLIAKLDRLSRNVAFLATLLEGDVPMVACDNPHATKFTLHILAAVAEHEADMISKRTKAALAAAKGRGVALGGWRGRQPSDADRAKAAAVRASRARETAIAVLPEIERLKAAGVQSLAELANGLNATGITTPRGKQWSASQVRRVLKFAAEITPAKVAHGATIWERTSRQSG